MDLRENILATKRKVGAIDCIGIKMKLFQLYENADIENVAGTAKDIAQILQNECSIAVDAYARTHKVLYRGIKSVGASAAPFISASIRTERQPLYLPLELHNAVNEAMLELGLKAHRGNSIFCTTRLSIAANWGQTYVVFPVDGWVGTVFDKVVDGYVVDEILDDAEWIMKSADDHDIKIQKLAAKLSELEPYSFKSAEALQLILKERYVDILITGNKYYALIFEKNSPEDNLTNQVLKILGI